ncbi:MAG: D-alanine--D-alanine ligase [Candidatus Harrisonbacteria bacterium]|nr:D-alanine--D-alanine ligase [Candidatus Harrisonbacteria bacterium]
MVKNKKIRVAVLMGGPSSEYEVSLKTGEMVIKNLDKRKFTAFPIKIEKDGTWPISLADLKEKCGVAFIAMHGEYGEDGQLQGTLETFQIPYTGSDPIASALAMNKQKTALLLTKNGLLTPKSISLSKTDPYLDWVINKNFKTPFVIKPADRGSSVGISIVRKNQELKKALTNAFQYSNTAIAQNYIQGKELTCGVLEINGNPIPLVPTEITPKTSEYFDYYAKYNTNGSEEITPPRLPDRTIRQIQMAALKAHKLLNCSGMSRTDMILQGDNLHILEVNTIPGMTEASLLPQQTKAMGIEFPQLLELIIRSALQKHGPDTR